MSIRKKSNDTNHRKAFICQYSVFNNSVVSITLCRKSSTLMNVFKRKKKKSDNSNVITILKSQKRSIKLICFQQTVGIPMGTNCVPLLADFFLYYYRASCRLDSILL